MPSTLSLRQKIGQLLMAGFDALTPDAQIENLIRNHHLGGVILFRRNTQTPQQVAALNRRLQTINAERSGTPLFIAVDQEGGVVARIENGVTPLPSALAFRTAGTPADCEALTRIANEELCQLGFNVNFAPVLDVNNNPRNPVIGVRAFGETVAEVCEYGLAALRGIQQAGIAATAKHFPGHGDTDVDSHLGLPRVPHDRARLDVVELAPFRAAIAAGVEAIMSAHVVFPAFERDPDTPSTLSHAVLTGLLREELGFRGVVFTDCLEMDAIAKGIGVVEGAVRAFKAGADVLLVSHREDRQIAVIEALVRAVENGEIGEARIDESLARILELKARLPDWRALPADPSALLATPEHLALSKRIHAAAVSWAGQPNRLDPARPALVITCEVREHTEIDVVATAEETLGGCLAARGMGITELRLPLAPSGEDIALAATRAGASEQVLFVSYNAVLKPAQQALLAALPQEKTWLVAGRLPYDLDLAPQAHGRLAACSNRPAALQALAEALLRKRGPTAV
ncbi:beta-N-acetylhexosaminidase [Formivibrio citricus]|uniref:Beta-N-acetylhexosaminidase n=1 Tax=Formivibrio citricus TaxID=83765 RepID=A0A1I4W051_9NEIS|nr:beta-N-acetylhexosaminidase [Formivibrio citricus]SFN06813.1 beta-N-acetylhexosaminidase [Formivibrio citricus]